MRWLCLQLPGGCNKPGGDLTFIYLLSLCSHLFLPMISFLRLYDDLRDFLLQRSQILPEPRESSRLPVLQKEHSRALENAAEERCHLGLAYRPGILDRRRRKALETPAQVFHLLLQIGKHLRVQPHLHRKTFDDSVRLQLTPEFRRPDMQAPQCTCNDVASSTML